MLISNHGTPGPSFRLRGLRAFVAGWGCVWFGEAFEDCREPPSAASADFNQPTIQSLLGITVFHVTVGLRKGVVFPWSPLEPMLGKGDSDVPILGGEAGSKSTLAQGADRRCLPSACLPRINRHSPKRRCI